MTRSRTLIALFITVLFTASAGCLDDDEEENRPPVANAGPNQIVTMVDNKATVQFTAVASHDPDGDILTYRWDFDASNGDNDFDSTVRDPVHNYYWAGTYLVTLRVSDGKLVAMDTMTVTVRKDPGLVEAKISSPASFRATVGANEEAPFTFDGSESTSRSGSIRTWEWDFNYSTPDDFDVQADGHQVDHAFPSGTYRTGLRVTNDSGMQAYDSVEVRVNYNMSYNGTLARDAREDFPLPLNSDRAFYLKVVLLSDNSNNDGRDLDIYLYFPNGTEANNTSEVDSSHEEIRYDRNGPYRDNLKVLGEWKVTIHNSSYIWGDMDYTLHIDVVYFS